MGKPSVELGVVPDAPGWLRRTLDGWRGRRVQYDLRRYVPEVARINELEQTLRALPDSELRRRAEAVRAEPSAHDVRAEVFALVREAARRTIGLRHFDVQLVGGLALFEGRVVEMATGEGKTLVAVLPAVLAALSGRRVHVLEFNDYLAQRDAAWMGPVYRLLGVSVACVQGTSEPEERRQAYAADVTYVTAKEAGFDYLRDGLCREPEERVHAGFDFAIVDEADSILIDEARIPLVIAGSRPAGDADTERVAALVAELQEGEHYAADDARRNVSLTDEGFHRVEAALDRGALHEPDNAPLLAEVNLAIHARALLHRDVDYIVRGGGIEQVDEFTGRVVPDRQWPDGLQAALEAKEALRLREEGVVLGSVTLQHFFELYGTLSGMTGTARGEEEELQEFYGVPVVVLPTHRPCVREDLPDRIYSHADAKLAAVVEAVRGANAVGRPVLVGTTSVRESEALAARIRAAGLVCEVLNAKTDEHEARIVAEAGASGAITISTNMAGRGTDIRLGGADESARESVVATGGLYVIGTNRHESRRVDRQLRGRAGRQGDPGTSEFFVSLEDDLVVRYGVDDLLPAERRKRRDEPLGDATVRARLDWAQRVIEGQNFDIRRTLRKYSTLVEDQRRIVRELRDGYLVGATAPTRWQSARPDRYDRLVARFGAEPVAAAERRVTLAAYDEAWADCIAAATDLRERIHIVRLGNKDPLTEFIREADKTFGAALAWVDERIVGDFDALDLDAPDPFERLDVRGPSSTWTYLIDDNPWRDALGLHISGNLALSIGAAIHYPLYLLVALYRRHLRRRPPAERD